MGVLRYSEALEGHQRGCSAYEPGSSLYSANTPWRDASDRHAGRAESLSPVCFADPVSGYAGTGW